MSKKIAIYAGTFDPVTNGHLDMIERASKLFDELHVTLSVNINKKTMFTLEERIELLKQATSHLDNVIIDCNDSLTVEYAREIGATALVRGLRATNDFEYELQMAYANQFLDPNLETVFLMTRLNNTFISSSTVKEIHFHHHDVSELVPPCVVEALKNK